MFETGHRTSTVSQHLAKLRVDNLVTTCREAQTVYYSCATPSVHRILDMPDEIFSPKSDAENTYIVKTSTPWAKDLKPLYSRTRKLPVLPSQRSERISSNQVPCIEA